MSDGQTTAAYDHIASTYHEKWRDRAVMQRAATLFQTLLPVGSTVVDVGCGPGFDRRLLRANGLRVVGLDLSAGMLEVAQEAYPGEYVQADMRYLPLASAAVDGVWASASLLHLRRSDFLPALAGFCRVLRPNGLLYFSLKMGEGEGWQEDACGMPAPRFFTYWDADTVDAALAEAGFAVVAAWEDQAPAVRWLNRVARWS